MIVGGNEMEKPLEELLQDLEQELLRLGYVEGTMNFYRGRWKKLLSFACERGEAFFSEALGLDFLENQYHILRKDLDRSLSRRDVQDIRVIRMIGDFQLHHCVLRRYYKHQQLLTAPYFVEMSKVFRQYCEDKDYSNVTINHYVKQSERFMDYLAAQGIHDCSLISLPSVHNYLRTLAGYTYKTVEQNLCSIRAFLRYLNERGILSEDLASKTPMIQARKQTRIPSVWTKEELEALFEAIDHGSPKGKRDYAMILLACVMGMRVTDIKQLTFSNLNWERKELTYTQSKTHKDVTLPLVSEVGWALIDYLKHGRPSIDTPVIFIRHMAPFLPFAQSNHLNQIIRHYMQLAHIPTLKKHRGMHSLRHTAASRMLEHDTPLEVISSVLGHIDTDSTAVYLKVDLNKLRACPLSEEA